MSGTRAELDEVDLAILRLLQDNARISNAEIARRVGMASSAIYERIRKLEERKVILGYRARVSPKALGLDLMAYVRIQVAPQADGAEIPDRLGEIPEVQEIHRVVGEDCFFVKVRVHDTDELAALLDERIRAIEAVGATRTTIVLTTIKDGSVLPLPRGLRIVEAG